MIRTPITDRTEPVFSCAAASFASHLCDLRAIDSGRFRVIGVEQTPTDSAGDAAICVTDAHRPPTRAVPFGYLPSRRRQSLAPTSLAITDWYLPFLGV